VVWLLDGPGLARRLGELACARAAEHTPARYGAAVLDVYAEAAAVRAARVSGAAMAARMGVVPVA
jgi:hypothetical protein